MGVEDLRAAIQPEDVLTDQEYETLQRAQVGEISCPWGCERPLSGAFYFFVEGGRQYKGVRLACSGCGFDEH